MSKKTRVTDGQDRKCNFLTFEFNPAAVDVLGVFIHIMCSTE